MCWAALTKMAATWPFAEGIANYRMLPAQANQLLAVTLPWIEISCGLLLLAGLWTRAAAALSGGLFLTFSIALGVALLRGLDIECGCFGTGSGAKAGVAGLLIDLAALASCLLVIRFESGRPSGAAEAA